MGGDAKDYLEMKIADVATKLNRLEHVNAPYPRPRHCAYHFNAMQQTVSDLSDAVTKIQGQIAQLFKEKADKKDVVDINDKLSVLSDQLKRGFCSILRGVLYVPLYQPARSASRFQGN